MKSTEDSASSSQLCLMFTGASCDEPNTAKFFTPSGLSLCMPDLQIFSMSPQAQRLMQQRCMDRATAFQYDRFERRLHDLINATETMKPSLPLVAERVRSLRM